MRGLRRGLRIARKVLTWLVATVVALVFAVWVALQTDWGRELVRDYAESRLDAMIAGEASIGGLEGDLLGDFTVRDVVLRDDAGEVIAVRSIAVEYDLWRLFGKHAEVESLRIDGVRVRARTDADGVLNLAALFAAGDDEEDDEDDADDTAPSPPSFTVRVARLEVTGIDAHYAAPGQPSRSVRGASVSGRVRLDGAGLGVALQRFSGEVDPGDGAGPMQVSVRARAQQHLGGMVSVADLVARVDGGAVMVPAAGFDAERGLAHGVVRARGARALVERFAPDAGVRTGADAVAVVSRSGADRPYALALHASGGDAAADLAATVDPTSMAVSGRLALRGLDAAALVAGAPPTEGEVVIEFAGVGAAIDDAAAAVVVSGRGAAEGLRADDVQVVAILADGRVIVVAAAAVPSGLVHAGGAVDLRGATPALDLRVGGDIERLERALGGRAPVAGGARVVASARGALGDLSVEGSARVRNLRYQDNRVPSGVARFALTGVHQHPVGKVEFSAGQVFVGPDRMGRVSGTARVRDGGRRIVVAVRSRDPSAAISLRANAEIRLDGDRVEVVLGDYGAGAAGLEVGGRGGRVSVVDGTTRIRAIELTSPAGTISVDGVIGTDRLALTIIARRIDLARLSRTLGIEPALRGIVELEGTLDQRGRALDARGTVAVRDAGVDGYEAAVSGDLVLRLEDGVMRVSGTTSSPQLGRGRLGLAVRAPRDPMDAGAWLALTEAALEPTSLAFENIDLAALPIAARDAPTAGRAAVKLDVGAGAREATLSVRGTDVALPAFPGTVAPAIDVRLEGSSIVATVTAVTSNDERARVEVVVEAPPVLSDVDAWTARGKAGLVRAELRAGPVELERLALFGLVPPRARGDVALTATVGPALASADSELVLRTRKPKGRTVTTSVRLNSRHRDDDVDAGLAVLIEGQPYLIGSARLAAGMRAVERGDLDAVRAAALEVDVTATTLPLHLVGDLVDADERLVGALSGTASVRGSVDQPVVVASLNGAGTGTARVRFAKLSAGLRLARQRLVLEVLGEQRAGGVLEVDASADLSRDDGELTASVVARAFDLGFLRGVLPQLGLAGKVESNLRVTGTTATPVVAGTAALRDGQVRPGPPLRILEDLAATVEISPAAVTLEATGRAGRGELAVSARAGMRALEPQDLSLTLTMTDLPVEAGGQLVSVESRTVVEGQRVGDVWNIVTRVGDTAVGLPKRDNRYLHPMAKMDDVVFVDGGRAALVRKEPAPRARAPVRPRAPSGVKVRLLAPATITVRGQEAKAVLSIDLRYDDTGSAPAILGTVRTESGWLELFGRRYTIDRAIASFSGDPNPGLDVRLVHEFSTTTLFVDVVGSAEAPELRLSSDPPIYDNAQLLSFVLGASPDDDAGGERRLGDRAVGVISSLVANQVQSLVRDVLPIDVLRIELADDSASPGRMTVGKWLSNRLFVAYRHRFEAGESENSGEATVEWRFLPRWLLEAFYGPEESAADVVWIKRF